MELITENLIDLEVALSSQEAVIRHAAALLEKDGRLHSADGYVEDVRRREREFSTGVGFGIATPHAKSDHVKVASLVFLRLKQPILWEEEEEAGLIFQIAVSASGEENKHLEILSRISRKLLYEDFRSALTRAERKADILALLEGVL